MATLVRWLFRNMPEKASPKRVESDSISRMHAFEDTPMYRDIIMGWTMRFDDVLDADKIYGALTKLIETGHWRRLGGRLRLSSDGKIEIHIPDKFTPERPAVRYSRITFDVSIDEHALGGLLPKATQCPSLHPGSGHFRSFVARADAPTTIDDYLYSDEPQIALHITSFTDATLVGLSYPHTMADASGRLAIVHAMSLILAGREQQVPPLFGADEDPLCNVGTSFDDQEPYVLAPQQMGVFQAIHFVLRFLWDSYWQGEVDSRIAVLPPAFLTQLREKAEANLREDASVTKPTFLSDGDILTAWAAQKIMAIEPRPRPAIIGNALNVRGMLKPALREGGVYVTPLVFQSYALLSAETATSSMGHIAMEVRQNLTKQANEAQARAFIRESRAALQETGSPRLYGDPTSKLISVSNWTKLRFYDVVDFSPAVALAGRHGDQRQVPPGRLVYQHAQQMTQSRWTRNVVNIFGKDVNGNYWINAYLPLAAWHLVEKEFDAAKI